MRNERRYSSASPRAPRVATLVFLISSISLFLAGCIGPLAPSPEKLTRHFERRATQSGFLAIDPVPGQSMPLAAWLRPGDPSRGLRVYIEGDGRAFTRRFERSSNPTPRRPIGFELAALDTYPGPVLYLGRPCQYAPTEAIGCDPKLWTVARYGDDVIQATGDRLTQIVSDTAKGHPVTLVGYSGGGVIAALLAAKHIDVALFVSVAAPLDLEAWTYLKGVPRLALSDSPLEYADRLAQIPQLHFTSDADQIVPAIIVERYRDALGTEASLQLVNESDVAHAEWPRVWPRLLPLLDLR